MHLNGCKERGTNYNEQEGSVRYDEIESMNREVCSQRKNACDDVSIDNHSRSPKTLYMWAAICKPLWIVGSAIGNLRRTSIPFHISFCAMCSKISNYR